MVANREDLIEQIWKTLELVPQQGGHPWRTPALATISVDGRPTVRTVVLRSVKVESCTLIAHTDVRSPKVAELRANPESEWVFYDPSSQVQLRLRGETEVVTSGEEFEGAWDSTPILLRPNYGSVAPPGTLLKDPPERTTTGSTGGKENFALLCSRIREIDWLQLNQRGHERIVFIQEGSAWSGTWVVP